MKIEYLEHFRENDYYTMALRSANTRDKHAIEDDTLEALFALGEDDTLDDDDKDRVLVVPKKRKPRVGGHQGRHAKTHDWGGGLITYKPYERY